MAIFKDKYKTNIRSKVCSAIKSRQIIEFYYHGVDLWVEPFCLGIVQSDKADNEDLLCYQVGSYGELAEAVGWKLYRASEMKSLRTTDRVFSIDRPWFDLDNIIWKTIYCCVSKDGYDEIEPKKSDEHLTPSDVSEIKLRKNTEVDVELKKSKEPFTQSDDHAIKLDIPTDVDVKPEKPRRLFTPSYIRMIKLSRKLNHNKNISGDFYFHPTERKIVVKSIDLSLPNTLCEVNRRPISRLNEKNRQFCEKRWIEAYLINQAKHNDWKLKLEKNEYEFLLYQLKFRRGFIKGERQEKILDMLLYNDEKQCLVVLELKIQSDISVMNTTNIELADLVTKLKAVAETGEIAEAFGLGEIKGIFAYLVWPENDMKHDFGKYGLIEFEKIENPWELYKERGKDLEVRFNSKKGAFNLL
ncbi:hypothetical protein ACFLXF_02950 [Chloroflexota bacterium]